MQKLVITILTSSQLRQTQSGGCCSMVQSERRRPRAVRPGIPTGNPANDRGRRRSLTHGTTSTAVRLMHPSNDHGSEAGSRRNQVQQAQECPLGGLWTLRGCWTPLPAQITSQPQMRAERPQTCTDVRAHLVKEIRRQPNIVFRFFTNYILTLGVTPCKIVMR